MKIVDDATDRVEASDESWEAVAETLKFAAKETQRLRNFVRTLNYCLDWGKGGDLKTPTVVKFHRDFAPHSFIFYIWTFRYDPEANVTMVSDMPFVMGMIYSSSDNRWSTHS